MILCIHCSSSCTIFSLELFSIFQSSHENNLINYSVINLFWEVSILTGKKKPISAPVTFPTNVIAPMTPELKPVVNDRLYNLKHLYKILINYYF